jgi:hypothetical protein
MKQALLAVVMAFSLLVACTVSAQTSAPVLSSVGFSGLVTNQLPNPPTPPTVVPTCLVSCTYTWTYATVARDATGTTQGSGNGTTALGGKTLSASVFNTITTIAVTGASSCDVYRTGVPTGGSPTSVGIIGNVPCGTNLVDIGLTGNGATSTPATNTTGTINALGSLTTSGNITAATGTVTAQTFVANGSSVAGGDSFVTGTAVASVPTNSVTVEAPNGAITSYAIVLPNGVPSANSVMLFSANDLATVPATNATFGSLTDPMSTILATTQSPLTFTTGHLVSATVSSGMDLQDSGIDVATVTSPTDSLTITPGTATTPTVGIAATGSDSVISLSYTTKSTGSHMFQPGPSGDTNQMFQLRNAAGTIFASFDSSNKQFRIGDNATPGATLDVEGGFQVSSSGTPTKESGVGLVGAGLPGIVFNTASSTGSGTISGTMISATPSSNPENCGGSSNATCYRVSFYAFQVGQGSSCASNTGIAIDVKFTDPVTNSQSTITVGAFLITLNGTANVPIPPSSGGGGNTLAVGATGAYPLRFHASHS